MFRHTTFDHSDRDLDWLERAWGIEICHRCSEVLGAAVGRAAKHRQRRVQKEGKGKPAHGRVGTEPILDYIGSPHVTASVRGSGKLNTKLARAEAGASTCVTNQKTRRMRRRGHPTRILYRNRPWVVSLRIARRSSRSLIRARPVGYPTPSQSCTCVQSVVCRKQMS